MESLQDGRPTTNFCNGEGWSHIFHEECIKGWINTPIHEGGITCPLCRRIIQVADVENIPVHLWTPMNIVLEGSEIILTGAVIRNFYIIIQEWYKFQTLETIDHLALRSFAEAHRRVENSRLAGAEMGSLVNNSLVAYSQQRLTSNASSMQLKKLQENTNFLMGLAILFVILKTLRLYRRQYGGGGKILLINGESFQVPSHLEGSITESFDSIKQGLSKMNVKKGGRKTRRRYSTK